MDQLQNHEIRISSLEARMTEMQVTLVKLEGDMRLNNEMTKTIKETLSSMNADTSDMVNLLKGFRVFGRMSAWLGIILGAIIGLYTLNDYAKHRLIEQRLEHPHEVKK